MWVPRPSVQPLMWQWRLWHSTTDDMIKSYFLSLSLMKWVTELSTMTVTISWSMVKSLIDQRWQSLSLIFSLSSRMMWHNLPFKVSHSRYNNRHMRLWRRNLDEGKWVTFRTSFCLILSFDFSGGYQRIHKPPLFVRKENLWESGGCLRKSYCISRHVWTHIVSFSFFFSSAGTYKGLSVPAYELRKIRKCNTMCVLRKVNKMKWNPEYKYNNESYKI